MWHLWEEVLKIKRTDLDLLLVLMHIINVHNIFYRTSSIIEAMNLLCKSPRVRDVKPSIQSAKRVEAEFSSKMIQPTPTILHETN